jgi:selenocysteine lyase/cysteine desulfurase
MRGIYENDWNGIRLAFAIFNTKEEIDHAVQILKREIDNKSSNE